MGPPVFAIESGQYLQSRRGKSRNKVAVGEPAAGSFSDPTISLTCQAPIRLKGREVNGLLSERELSLSPRW